MIYVYFQEQRRCKFMYITTPKLYLRLLHMSTKKRIPSTVPKSYASKADQYRELKDG